MVKAKAGLAAAKDAYIPDITGLARYSYQSGIPFLVHNFGTFGATLSYDLFDGGRRIAEIKDSRTLLSEAELNLAKVKDEVAVKVETAYDKVEQLQNMVGVAEEALKVRVELARLSDRQLEQSEVLASARSEAHAKASSAKASYLEATLGLSLAQADLKRTIGQLPQLADRAGLQIDGYGVIRSLRHSPVALGMKLDGQCRRVRHHSQVAIVGVVVTLEG